MSSKFNKQQRGRVDSVLWLSVLALLAALGGFGYNVWQLQLGSGWDEQYRGLASDLRVITQDMNVSGQ